MNKTDIVKQILQDKSFTDHRAEGHAFAPINIALCKYWGKRDEELNLPVTSSFSISLGSKGAYIRVTINTKPNDEIYINGDLILNTEFAKSLQNFLDLFRPAKTFYKITTTIDVPIAIGLASSACIYAALVQALNHLYKWQLNRTQLSILARLGSGSACRSLWKGFVEWRMGTNLDGIDSHGFPMGHIWPELRIGLHIINLNKKLISSREAMRRTVATAKLYTSWPTKTAKDLVTLKQAIRNRDFKLLAETAETNALTMHAIMRDAIPPIIYTLPETIQARKKIWELRNSGILVYFTQDAGPNLKLLFLKSETKTIREVFPELEIIAPFSNPENAQVILVDENDKAIGIEEKLVAHQHGHLHRAFSVFITRKKENSIEVLLQQRREDKYHSGNQWSNTCCSHPRPDEDIISAAQRRLQEEMNCFADLYLIGKFQYSIKFANGLIENELDHVLVGTTEKETFLVNRREVQNYKWIKLPTLQTDLQDNPNKYTPWLPKALQIVLQGSNSNFNQF
ncbi:MAG: dihydrofolate reductase [Coxiella sp. DG_40]|nr:MAG: dihydrofolate reductase [Coxiella sp. DG_40]